MRSWIVANPQKWKAIHDRASKKYRLSHREKVNATQRKWKLNNPEKVSATNKRWRLKLRQALFDKYGVICVQCGATENLELDHVYNDAIPPHGKVDSGRQGRAATTTEWKEALEDTKGRFQILCKECNLAKSKKKAND